MDSDDDDDDRSIAVVLKIKKPCSKTQSATCKGMLSDSPGLMDFSVGLVHYFYP